MVISVLYFTNVVNLINRNRYHINILRIYYKYQQMFTGFKHLLAFGFKSL